MKDKSAVMTFDHLVKVIVDYYKKEEILAARALLEKAKYKIVRRKEPDVAQKTVEDIVKAFLDPNAKLPTFYAIEMSRCPPVDITHCDVTSILREVQALRREVREAGQQQVDVQSMQQQIMELREEVSLLRALHESSRIAIDPVSKTSPKQPPSFAEVASNLRTTDLPVVQKKNNPEKNASKPKSIVGKANSNSPAVVADEVRKIDLFISRLNSSTTENDAASIVKEALSSRNIEGEKHGSIVATKLKTRYENYSSFCVTIVVARSEFSTTLDQVYSEDTWPVGMLIRRYFKHNNNGAHK